MNPANLPRARGRVLSKRQLCLIPGHCTEVRWLTLLPDTHPRSAQGLSFLGNPKSLQKVAWALPATVGLPGIYAHPSRIRLAHFLFQGPMTIVSEVHSLQSSHGAVGLERSRFSASVEAKQSTVNRGWSQIPMKAHMRLLHLSQ